MDTLIIQLTHQKALKILLDLEELSLIRVLKKNVRPQQKLSDKYAGKLPEDIGERIQQYLSKNRDEWERNI
ncbi:MAG TPA: hypothetical protein ENJ53_09355 [Phaeodactylibacter sp.]|nr:hypothetical protein [Phaeodactylibacter sp.]